MSDHRGHAVLAPCIGICQIVLELPEYSPVVLDVALIGLAYIASEVNHRLVALSLAVVDVEADFSMPYKVLERIPVHERSHISKDVSGELLPVEQDVVHHGQGDRVRVVVSLAHCRRVISVHVINRNVRNGSEGVVDETFRTVGKLEVIIGVGICCRKSELNPFLELRVKVSAHAEAVEFGADDSTFLAHVRA